MKKHDLTIKVALLGVAFALLTLPALADYHYASHTGINTPPYTSWATAADSIQKAIDASSPHDTVYISAGQWYETVATGVYDSVAIIGAGMDSTYLSTTGNPTAILTVDYDCSVKGINFTIRGTSGCLMARAYASITATECKFKGSFGIAVSSGSYEIINCVFDSCNRAITGLSGYYLVKNNLIKDSYNDGGGYCMNIIENSAQIENNIIINNVPWIRYPDGLIIYDYPNVVIRNNIIADVSWGIVADPYLKSNNVIYTTQWAAFDNVDAGDSLINNSITRSAYISVQLGQAYMGYNNYWKIDSGLYIGVPPETVGNIYRNPMYISNNDFHLQMYSPLIDAGAPWLLDIDSSRSDIGVYGGAYGEIYEYVDLPPAVPESLRGSFANDTINLTWAYNTEADFANYFVYRDTISGFTPSGINLIAEPESSHFIDSDVSNQHNYYYRITAADNQYNISAYSNELIVITTGIRDQPNALIPGLTSIQSNYPNPFNSSTTIIYGVADLGPIPAQIEITIYDITGRKVRILVNERNEVGLHRVIWDGRDGTGAICPSGVYFARISQWGLELSGRPRKMVLMK